MREQGGEHGAVWGPVLHADEHRHLLWVFYSESRGECKVRPRPSEQ